MGQRWNHKEHKKIFRDQWQKKLQHIIKCAYIRTEWVNFCDLTFHINKSEEKKQSINKYKARNKKIKA